MQELAWGFLRDFTNLFLHTAFFWTLQGSGCNFTSDFEIVVGKKAAGLGLPSLLLRTTDKGISAPANIIPSHPWPDGFIRTAFPTAASVSEIPRHAGFLCLSIQERPQMSFIRVFIWILFQIKYFIHTFIEFSCPDCNLSSESNFRVNPQPGFTPKSNTSVGSDQEKTPQRTQCFGIRPSPRRAYFAGANSRCKQCHPKTTRRPHGACSSRRKVNPPANIDGEATITAWQIR